MKILLLDNYDSFTFNLLHYLQNTGPSVVVVRNDELTDLEFKLDGFDAAVLSPGPCTPNEAGRLMPFVAENINKKPILGVCLGMQAIGMHYGCSLTKAILPVHGKSSFIIHSGNGIFAGIKNPMQVGRYHSLVIKSQEKMNLSIDAEFNNEIMAISDESKMVWGVQFHPESILTPEGQTLINNWINLAQKYKKD